MFKLVIVCASLLTIANGQAPVLPSYYARPPPSDYPASLYNPSSYPQSSSSLNAALAYQQQQNLQGQQALAAYQQQANAAGLPQSYPLPSSRPAFTSNPSVNYSPNYSPNYNPNYSPDTLPAVRYQSQQVPQQVQPAQAVPQQAINYQPQTSYNPQGLQTISYQPSSEQPVAPAVTNYDPQPASYNPQPAYNPEEIGN